MANRKRGFLQPIRSEDDAPDALLDDDSLPAPERVDHTYYRDDAQEAFRAGEVDEAAKLYFLCGYPYGMIARLVGYVDWREAKQKIDSILEKEGRQKRTLRQNVEIAKLNRYESFLQSRAERGDVEAIEIILDIGKDRRRILADDEPPAQAPPQLPWQEIERVLSTVAAIQGTDPRMLLERFRTFAGQAGYLPAPTSAVIDGEVEEGDAEEGGDGEDEPSRL
jgi:hypothetical protein